MEKKLVFSRTSRYEAFSLIELIVVIGIIGILLSIAIPNFSMPEKDVKEATHSMSKLSQGSQRINEILENGVNTSISNEDKLKSRKSTIASTSTSTATPADPANKPFLFKEKSINSSSEGTPEDKLSAEQRLEQDDSSSTITQKVQEIIDYGNDELKNLKTKEQSINDLYNRYNADTSSNKVLLKIELRKEIKDFQKKIKEVDEEIKEKKRDLD